MAAGSPSSAVVDNGVPLNLNGRHSDKPRPARRELGGARVPGHGRLTRASSRFAHASGAWQPRMGGKEPWGVSLINLRATPWNKLQLVKRYSVWPGDFHPPQDVTCLHGVQPQRATLTDQHPSCTPKPAKQAVAVRSARCAAESSYRTLGSLSVVRLEKVG